VIWNPAQVLKHGVSDFSFLEMNMQRLMTLAVVAAQPASAAELVGILRNLEISLVSAVTGINIAALDTDYLFIVII
jgi:hypothetical protein